MRAVQSLWMGLGIFLASTLKPFLVDYFALNFEDDVLTTNNIVLDGK